MDGRDVTKSTSKGSKCFHPAEVWKHSIFVLKNILQTRFGIPENNPFFFQRADFSLQNKKYNCVSSSISQNMMNEQSRTIYIFCRIFLMSWILPKSRHASCVSFYYNWTEITGPIFLLLDSSGFYFCLFRLKTTTKTKATQNKIHTRVQLGCACF